MVPPSHTEKEGVSPTTLDQVPSSNDEKKEQFSSTEEYFRALIQQFNTILRVLKKSVGYLNGHAAGMTLLVSIFLTISTFIVRFLAFCHEMGMVQYWSLDASAIDLSSENLIYQILFSAILCTLFILVSWMFFVLLSVQPEKPSKPFHMAPIIAICLFFLLVFSAIYLNLFFTTWNLRSFLASFIISFLNICVGVIFVFMKRLLKDDFKALITSYPVQSIIVSVILIIGFGCLGLYHIGADSAKSQRTFPLLNDTQVVVYSTSTTYHTARYTIDGDTIIIDTSKQGTYTRVDGELELHTFETVKIQN